MKTRLRLDGRVSMLAFSFTLLCGGCASAPPASRQPLGLGPLRRVADSLGLLERDAKCGGPGLGVPHHMNLTRACVVMQENRLAYFYTDSSQVIAIVGVRWNVQVSSLPRFADSLAALFGARMGPSTSCPPGQTYAFYRSERWRAAGTTVQFRADTAVPSSPFPHQLRLEWAIGDRPCDAWVNNPITF